MPPNPAPTASTSTHKRKATRDDNGDLVELPIKKPKQQLPKTSETVNQKLAAVSKAGNSNIPTESSKKNPQTNPEALKGYQMFIMLCSCQINGDWRTS